MQLNAKRIHNKSHTYGSYTDRMDRERKKPFRAAFSMEIRYSVFHFWLNCWILCKLQYSNVHEISYYLWLSFQSKALTTHTCFIITELSHSLTRNSLPQKKKKQLQITNRSAKSFSFSPVFDMSNELNSQYTVPYTTSHHWIKCIWSWISNC